MKQLQVYTYTIPALGSVQITATNDNWIVTASTGQLAVRGDTFGKLTGIVAGQGLKSVPFSRLELIDESGAPNTVTILLAPVEFVNQVFSGSVTVTQASIDALNRPELPTNEWKSNVALTINQAVQVFSAASNVNGAVLWLAQSIDYGTAPFAQTFLTKATLPAGPFDGDVICAAVHCGTFSTNVIQSANLPIAQRIPAGVGLYFSTSVASGAGFAHRVARYTLL